MNLKIIGTALGLLFLSLPVAQARLGMSLAECRVKYGPDTVITNAIYGEVHVFRIGAIEIHLVFEGIPPGDVAVVASYRNLDGTKSFTDRAIQDLLDKNTNGGSEWELPKTYTDLGTKTQYRVWEAYKHAEWTLRAQYDDTGLNAGVLIIQTKAEFYLEQQKEEANGV
jgi:hypothetical protein